MGGVDTHGGERLADRLRRERDGHVRHSLLYWTQVLFSFHSNHMEGSSLSLEQTAQLYEGGLSLAGAEGERFILDDMLTVSNHFRAVDYLLTRVDDPVDRKMVTDLHSILMNGTADQWRDWMNVGGYKRRGNEIRRIDGATIHTARPEDVPALMDRFFAACAAMTPDSPSLALAHWMFEKIHPLSDGNGRVGRLLLFKECLRLGTVPPLFRADYGADYLRALDAFPQAPDMLVRLMRQERRYYLDRFVGRLAAGQVASGWDDTADGDVSGDDSRLRDAVRFDHDVDSASRAYTQMYPDLLHIDFD
ncbi:Fic family protein [Bifidobacterium choloepi]|nr:Fic family protein [Bifidobacterium choloepi]